MEPARIDREKAEAYLAPGHWSRATGTPATPGIGHKRGFGT